MNFITRQCRRVANKTTKLVGRRMAESIGMYFVCEYPKSGGTWLGKMLADVLQVPYPRPSVLPVTFPAVVHNHWRYDPRLHNVFYLYRDGRDVMTSYFFHRMRRLAAGDPATVAMFARRYDRLFGRGYDRDDSRGLMARFIEEEFRRPRGARLNWADHVRGWRGDAGRPHVAYLSYEQLRADCCGTLRRVVREVTAREPDPWFVETAVEKFSMERQTGRRAGTEDRSSFVRKGVVGDWRNHFSREAAERFRDLAGDVLVDLGYERDDSWVDTVDP